MNRPPKKDAHSEPVEASHQLTTKEIAARFGNVKRWDVAPITPGRRPARGVHHLSAPATSENVLLRRQEGPNSAEHSIAYNLLRRLDRCAQQGAGYRRLSKGRAPATFNRGCEVDAPKRAQKRATTTDQVRQARERGGDWWRLFVQLCRETVRPRRFFVSRLRIARFIPSHLAGARAICALCEWPRDVIVGVRKMRTWIQRS